MPFGLIWFGVICLLLLVQIRDTGREERLWAKWERELSRA